jgi:hypothetical protein
MARLPGPRNASSFVPEKNATGRLFIVKSQEQERKNNTYDKRFDYNFVKWHGICYSQGHSSSFNVE